MTVKTPMMKIYIAALKKINDHAQLHLKQAILKYAYENKDGGDLHMKRAHDFDHIREYIYKRIAKGYN